MRSARPELPHVYGVAHGMLVKVAKRAKNWASGPAQEQLEPAGSAKIENRMADRGG